MKRSEMRVDDLQYGAELVVAGLARRHARRANRRNSVAVVGDDRRLTWAELDERAGRWTDRLRSLGVGRGDVIALLMTNRIEFFQIVLAAADSGAVVAPQSPKSSHHELVHAIEATGAMVLIAEGGELRALAVGAASEVDRPVTMIDLDLDPAPEVVTRAASSGAEIGGAVPDEDDAIWFAATGGTTGRPKLVRVPHRVLVEMWLYMAIEFEIGRSDTMLVAGSLHHGLGFGFALQQLYVGGRVVVLPEFDARGVIDAIREHGVTVLPAAPAILNMVLDELDRRPADTSSLRTIVSAGSPLHDATKRRLSAAFPGLRLFEHYGATEAGFFTVLHPEDQFERPGSCGMAFFGSEVEVRREDGTVAPAGEIGLVYKRGLVEGGGYFGNPAATAEMFDGDWATVGDLGYLDDDGYLYLVDRQADMIVSGGVNVFPAELESAIAELPGVSAVAVVGVPDDRWGESPKAFVVRRPGSNVTEEDVIAACTGKLAPFKRPRHVEFVDHLPRSAAGKVLKRVLREREWDGRGTSVG